MHFRLNTLIGVGLSIYGTVLAMPAAVGTISARQSFSGTATFFFQGGVAGACGTVHSDTDFIVALQTDTYANGINCGASITLTDTDTGVTATAIVADMCPGCDGPGSIDLSQGLFEVFAPDSQGVFPVSWFFN